MGAEYEELKRKAEELGYSLIRRQKYVKFKPCICGHNYREKWFKGDTVFFKCKKCGLKSKPGKSEREARELWNGMVENYIVEKEYTKE